MKVKLFRCFLWHLAFSLPSLLFYIFYYFIYCALLFLLCADLIISTLVLFAHLVSVSQSHNKIIKYFLFFVPRRLQRLTDVVAVGVVESNKK